MWTLTRARTEPWDVPITGGDAPNRSEKQKSDYEARVLRAALPALFEAPPLSAVKRESPDFKLQTTDGSWYVEIVDAVPVADLVENSGRTSNVEEMRGDQRRDPGASPRAYRVEPKRFAESIRDAIRSKQAKAVRWLEPDLPNKAKLALVVNAGLGPLWMREYFPTVEAFSDAVDVSTVEPFDVVSVVDGTDAFVWRA